MGGIFGYFRAHFFVFGRRAAIYYGFGRGRRRSDRRGSNNFNFYGLAGQKKKRGGRVPIRTASFLAFGGSGVLIFYYSYSGEFGENY